MAHQAQNMYQPRQSITLQFLYPSTPCCPFLIKHHVILTHTVSFNVSFSPRVMKDILERDKWISVEMYGH